MSIHEALVGCVKARIGLGDGKYLYVELSEAKGRTVLAYDLPVDPECDVKPLSDRLNEALKSHTVEWPTGFYIGRACPIWTDFCSAWALLVYLEEKGFEILLGPNSKPSETRSPSAS